jgi:hypothetical protein
MSSKDPEASASDTLVTCRRLGRLLRRLADVGFTIIQQMSQTVVERRSRGARIGTAMQGGPGRTDLNLVWDLLARATRWTQALRARLKAEAAAARARMEPKESLFDTPDWHENLLPACRTRAPRQVPDDCIDGKPVAEVVAQICADLGLAAVLMDSREAAEQIAKIAEKARALVDAPDEAWTPLPVDPSPYHTAAQPEPATITHAAPVPPTPVPPAPAPPAPDTG